MKKNTLCSENNDVSSKKKRIIIKELVQGQEAATQLKLLLQNPIGDTSLSAEELLGNVLTSFAETLSLLASNHSQEQPCPSDDYSGGESHCMKRSNLTPPKKVGRGCYKRRRTEHTWTTISPTADDNHAWRKYGEKEIQNSKFPRSYFRCSRKYDQNCRAIKHVQRTQENPCMYQITYIGMHTCKATPNDAPCLVMVDCKYLKVTLINWSLSSSNVGHIYMNVLLIMIQIIYMKNYKITWRRTRFS
ncbi:WRKY DNA-binding transcription factor 70-like isoform X3 [Arachis stenosperma]|uniref:WRKY DNA-binding transcription factor 70-like isoform X3 n=1 Tax=Arachis stenosperma TaxID=217475 RepID=UPI0025AC95E8|nr:WRKY DNA-binding transcription factor 70-like isoform X3 [Arachis stenosperma]